MAGFKFETKSIGQVSDVASSLDDLEVLYRKKSGPPPSFTDPNPPEPEPADNEEGEAGEAGVRNDVPRSKSLRTWDAVPEVHWPEDKLGSETYSEIMRTFGAMDASKYRGSEGRNTWQHRQAGGEGEPYYRDPEGFESAIQMTIEHGRQVYAEKWGHRDCNLVEVGLRPEHAWRVEKDWEWRDKHQESYQETDESPGVGGD